MFVIGPPGPIDRRQTFEWRRSVAREYYLDPSQPPIPVPTGECEMPGFLKTRHSLVLDENARFIGGCGAQDRERLAECRNPGGGETGTADARPGGGRPIDFGNIRKF